MYQEQSVNSEDLVAWMQYVVALVELDVCLEASDPIPVFGVNIGMNRIFALFRH